MTRRDLAAGCRDCCTVCQRALIRLVRDALDAAERRATHGPRRMIRSRRVATSRPSARSR
jgi:hypothetical protein